MTATYEQAMAIENGDISFEDLLEPRMCEGECGREVADHHEGLCDFCTIDSLLSYDDGVALADELGIYIG